GSGDEPRDRPLTRELPTVHENPAPTLKKLTLLAEHHHVGQEKPRGTPWEGERGRNSTSRPGPIPSGGGCQPVRPDRVPASPRVRPLPHESRNLETNDRIIRELPTYIG